MTGVFGLAASEDGRLPYFATRQINRRGVVVVRGVVPADAALRWRDSLLVREQQECVVLIVLYNVNATRFTGFFFFSFKGQE